MLEDSLDGDARPTPLWALELPELPTDHHFRRDHFGVPELDPAGWRLQVAGAVEQPLRLSLAEVQALPAQTLKVVLECAGHRRTELDPPAEGIPWGAGAVGEARWTGVPLRELLALARPSRRAAAPCSRVPIAARLRTWPVSSRSRAACRARALDSFPWTPEREQRYEEAFAAMQPTAERMGLDLRRGREVYPTEALRGALDGLRLDGTSAVLVEFPGWWLDVDDAVGLTWAACE